MGFDANSAGQPLVNVHKKTTQVNVWMAIGVAVFFVVSAAVLFWLSHRHGPDERHTVPEQTSPTAP